MKVNVEQLHLFAQAGCCNPATRQGALGDIVAPTSNEPPTTYADYIDFIDNEGALIEADFNALQKLDLLDIVADREMSENHPGGDSIIGIVEAVVRAITLGYIISTWYGPNTEVLIIGHRDKDLEIVMPTAAEEETNTDKPH